MVKPIKVTIPQEVASDFIGHDTKKHYTAENTIKMLVQQALIDFQRDGVDKLKFKLCLLTCKGCGRLGVSIVKDKNDGGYRLTSHKCGGHWGSQEIFDCSIWESEFEQYVRKDKK